MSQRNRFHRNRGRAELLGGPSISPKARKAVGPRAQPAAASTSGSDPQAATAGSPSRRNSPEASGTSQQNASPPTDGAEAEPSGPSITQVLPPLSLLERLGSKALSEDQPHHHPAQNTAGDGEDGTTAPLRGLDALAQLSTRQQTQLQALGIFDKQQQQGQPHSLPCTFPATPLSGTEQQLAPSDENLFGPSTTITDSFKPALQQPPLPSPPPTQIPQYSPTPQAPLTQQPSNPFPDNLHHDFSHIVSQILSIPTFAHYSPDGYQPQLVHEPQLTFSDLDVNMDDDPPAHPFCNPIHLHLHIHNYLAPTNLSAPQHSDEFSIVGFLEPSQPPTPQPQKPGPLAHALASSFVVAPLPSQSSWWPSFDVENARLEDNNSTRDLFGRPRGRASCSSQWDILTRERRVSQIQGSTPTRAIPHCQPIQHAAAMIRKSRRSNLSRMVRQLTPPPPKHWHSDSSAQSLSESESEYASLDSASEASWHSSEDAEWTTDEQNKIKSPSAVSKLLSWLWDRA